MYSAYDGWPSLPHAVGLLTLHGPPPPQGARTPWGLVRIVCGCPMMGSHPKAYDGPWEIQVL